jgi:ADP-ribosyl-[dinitrogen reductase] hydrolase
MMEARKVDIQWDGVTLLPGCYPEDPRIPADVLSLLNAPGVTTDDTQLSRVVAKALCACSGYDPSVLARAYVAWFEGRSFVGVPRGMGGTLEASFRRLSQDIPWQISGEQIPPEKPCGTGTVMRAGVFGSFSTRLHQCLEAAEKDSEVTHRHIEAKAGSIAMAAAVYYALKEERPAQFFATRMLHFVLEALANRGYGHSATSWALRSVYVLSDHRERTGRDTSSPELFTRLGMGSDSVGLVARALLFAGNATTYRTGVVHCIEVGGDTDTAGAMAGVVLGARFGLESIPENWVKGVYESTAIQSEDAELMQLRGK